MFERTAPEVVMAPEMMPTFSWSNLVSQKRMEADRKSSSRRNIDNRSIQACSNPTPTSIRPAPPRPVVYNVLWRVSSNRTISNMRCRQPSDMSSLTIVHFILKHQSHCIFVIVGESYCIEMLAAFQYNNHQRSIDKLTEKLTILNQSIQ